MRKKIGLILSALLLCAVTLPLAACFGMEDKSYTQSGVTISMPSRYESETPKKSDDDFERILQFSADGELISVNRFSKDTAAKINVFGLARFADYVAASYEEDDVQIKSGSSENVPYLYFDMSYMDDMTPCKQFEALSEGDEYFYEIAMSCTSKEYAEKLEDYKKIADSLRADNLDKQPALESKEFVCGDLKLTLNSSYTQDKDDEFYISGEYAAVEVTKIEYDGIEDLGSFITYLGVSQEEGYTDVTFSKSDAPENGHAYAFAECYIEIEGEKYNEYVTLWAGNDCGYIVNMSVHEDLYEYYEADFLAFSALIGGKELDDYVLDPALEQAMAVEFKNADYGFTLDLDTSFETPYEIEGMVSSASLYRNTMIMVDYVSDADLEKANVTTETAFKKWFEATYILSSPYVSATDKTPAHAGIENGYVFVMKTASGRAVIFMQQLIGPGDYTYALKTAQSFQEITAA